MAGSTDSVRVVFWNTWLLRPRLWPGGPPVPFADQLFAPDVGRRAPLVGQALAGRFDVCALAEVFDEHEQDTVAMQWDEAAYQPGPRSDSITRPVGSGLMTLVNPRVAEVEATASLAFQTAGDRRDSDSYATKGALHTRLRFPGGAGLDVVSTHLLAGGEFLPIPGSGDHARHHRARMAQVDELVEFAQRERDQENPLLLVGDFNVAAHDHRLTDDPEAYYRDLAEHLAPLEVSDLWVTHGVGPGPTSGFTSVGQIPPDDVLPDCVLDQDPARRAARSSRPTGKSTGRSTGRAGDVAPVSPTDTDHRVDPGAGDRIDHLWYSPPWRRARTEVQLDRPRRWAFPGRAAKGGPGGSLSDHLALSVTVHLRRR